MKRRCKIVYVLQRLVWVVYDVRLFQLQFLFLNQSVYYGNGGDVHNVAHGAIGIGEVYGFVQTHLYRTALRHWNTSVLTSFPLRLLKGYFLSRSSRSKA